MNTNTNIKMVGSNAVVSTSTKTLSGTPTSICPHAVNNVRTQPLVNVVKETKINTVATTQRKKQPVYPDMSEFTMNDIVNANPDIKRSTLVLRVQCAVEDGVLTITKRIPPPNKTGGNKTCYYSKNNSNVIASNKKLEKKFNEIKLPETETFTVKNLSSINTGVTRSMIVRYVNNQVRHNKFAVVGKTSQPGGKVLGKPAFVYKMSQRNIVC